MNLKQITAFVFSIEKKKSLGYENVNLTTIKNLNPNQYHSLRSLVGLERID